MNPFKPGDWVKYKDQQDTTIYKVMDILSNDLIDIEDTIVDKYDIELWQPKPNEWCWFWNKEIDVPILSKLSDITNYEDLPTIYYSEHPMYIKLGEDDNYEIVESYNFNNCEPFIGQLPTFIKDQS